MYVEYKCPKCGTTGHKEMHRIGEGEDDGLYTCITCWEEWAEPYRKKRMEEERKAARKVNFR